MPDIAERTEPLRLVIDAEELKGFAHAENELTRFLWDFPDNSQKVAALEALKIRMQSWPQNDLSRFLELRVERKLQTLKERVPRHAETGPIRAT
jgi:hypothetical protein